MSAPHCDDPWCPWWQEHGDSTLPAWDPEPDLWDDDQRRAYERHALVASVTKPLGADLTMGDSRHVDTAVPVTRSGSHDA